MEAESGIQQTVELVLSKIFQMKLQKDFNYIKTILILLILKQKYPLA